MEATIRTKFCRVRRVLDERARRLWAAAEAKALGRGGPTLVAKATGMSRSTIHNGLRELTRRGAVPAGRTRRSGGGRQRLTTTQPRLLSALDALVEPSSRGDPQTPLRWTCKSVRRLADELCRQGFQVGRQTVAAMLHTLDYSLQANRKTREGKQHPDRDAQFGYIARRVRAFQARQQPVISVDTKKKELVGDFKNAGREWLPQGQPRLVGVHDFPDRKLGKAIPYGVYDLTANMGWVSVGVDHDTAKFAVETIRRWWRHMGRRRYPQATELLIMADGGGSNGSRTRLWKVALQELADELGLAITVCHFPPGTSKWNKIEHRLFSQITLNWRGRPLTSHEVIVNLIGNTTNAQGLRVRAALDKRRYPTGVKTTATEFSQVNLHPAAFHGDWNYTIHSNRSANRKAA
jgi:transposase